MPPKLDPFTRITKIVLTGAPTKFKWAIDYTFKFGQDSPSGIVSETPAGNFWVSLVSLDSHGNILDQDGPHSMQVLGILYNSGHSFGNFLLEAEIDLSLDDVQVPASVALYVYADDSVVFEFENLDIWNGFYKATETNSAGKTVQTVTCGDDTYTVNDGNLGAMVRVDSGGGPAYLFQSPLTLQNGVPTPPINVLINPGVSVPTP